MPSEKTKQKALDALDGMRQIVKREMFTRGEYVTENVVNKKLEEEGALCQGRKYCAIGSLWIGGGVKLERDEFTFYDWAKGENVTSVRVELPGVSEYERKDFLRNRPGLKLAHKAINDAAQDWIDKYNLQSVVDKQIWEDPIEALFEGGARSRKPGARVGRPELLKIIASAKRKVKAA